MARSRPSFPIRVLAACLHPRFLYVLLPYFMVLVVIGTIAQKFIGNFAATHRIFNAFVFWLGPVPLPGGALVLGILFCNLCAHFVTKSRLQLATFGTALAHLGVLVLLFGGLVTLVTQQEGFVILRYTQDAAHFYDYHQRELVVIDAKGREVVFPDRNLSAKTSLRDPSLPFTLTIHVAYRNSTLREPARTSDKRRFDGVAATHRLVPLPETPQDETNQMGIEFDVYAADNHSSYVTTEFSPQPTRIQVKGGTYRIALRRKAYALPFSLALRRFERTNYPGSQRASDYRSEIDILEHGHTWPAAIAMNKPLRYKGHTFYQASVLTLPDGEVAPVLNVVQNTGWLFPYAATALLFIGLAWHGWRRWHENA